MNEKMRINPGFNCTVLRDVPRSVEYYDYRRLWELAPKYNYVGEGPIHLDLEVTARCQLKCPGCPSTKLKFQKGDMPLDMAVLAMEEHRELGGMSVKFNWRGEPTLYPNLGKLLDLADDLGYVDIMFNTNGVALNRKLARKLTSATTVIWSIDSVDPERYVTLRPGAKLDVVLKNLKDFCEVAPAETFIRVQRIQYPDEPMPHEDFVNYFWQNFEHVNAVASNAYKEKGKGGRRTRSQPCAQPWQRLIVAYDGQVGPCCEWNRLGAFGRFPEDSLKEIWQSTALKQLRRFHWEGEQNEIPGCAECDVTKVR